MDDNYRGSTDSDSNLSLNKIEQSPESRKYSSQEKKATLGSSAHRWPIFQKAGKQNKYMLALDQKAEKLFWYLDNRSKIYIYIDTIENYALKKEGFIKIRGHSQAGPRYDGDISDHSTKYEIFRRVTDDSFALKHDSIVYLYERKRYSNG